MTQTDIAILGTDGTVGGPGGSPLTPSVVNTTGEATNATAGTNGALPAQVAGYLEFTDSSGVTRKIPYFDV